MTGAVSVLARTPRLFAPTADRVAIHWCARQTQFSSAKLIGGGPGLRFMHEPFTFSALTLASPQSTTKGRYKMHVASKRSLVTGGSGPKFLLAGRALTPAHRRIADVKGSCTCNGLLSCQTAPMCDRHH
jgi:hypothetical protein